MDDMESHDLENNNDENDVAEHLSRNSGRVFFRSRIRRFFSAKHLCECLQPLCFVAYCHGLTRFYISGNGEGKKVIKKSIFGSLNGVFHIVCYCVCYVLTLQNNFESIAGYFFRSRISYFGDLMQIVSGFIGVTVIYLTAIAPNQRLESSFSSLSEMDAQLRSVGIKILYSKILRFSYIFLFIMFVVNTVYIQGTLWLLGSVGLTPSFELIATFTIQHSVIAIAITMFSCFTKLVEMRFVMLNKELVEKEFPLLNSMIILSYLKYVYLEYRRPRDVFACFHMLFFMAFVFGLAPFIGSTTDTKREIHSTVLGCLNIVVRIVAFNWLFYYHFLEESTVVSLFFTSNVSNFTASLQRVNGMLSFTTVLTLCLLRRLYLQRVVMQFHAIEQRLQNVGLIIQQRASAIRINIHILILSFLNYFFIYYGLFGILKKNEIYISAATAVAFYAPNYVVCGMVTLYSAICYKINEHLRAINKVLKNLGQQWERGTVKVVPPKQRSLQCLDSFSMYTIVTKNPSEIVHESMEIHQLICDAAATANKYFTYQLLTIISIAFLIIVFDAYYVLETLLGKSRRESKFKTVEFVTFFSCQMILYVLAIISIVEGSNRAIKKSEKTGGIVHGLLNKAKDPEVKEKLKQFSMQLLHLKVNFTAAGLFNIDRTLYFTISGALTTYLIILLQFTSHTLNTNSDPPQQPAIGYNGTNITMIN